MIFHSPIQAKQFLDKFKGPSHSLGKEYDQAGNYKEIICKTADVKTFSVVTNNRNLSYWNIPKVYQHCQIYLDI